MLIVQYAVVSLSLSVFFLSASTHRHIDLLPHPICRICVGAGVVSPLNRDIKWSTSAGDLNATESRTPGVRDRHRAAAFYLIPFSLKALAIARLGRAFAVDNGRLE